MNTEASRRRTLPPLFICACAAALLAACGSPGQMIQRSTEGIELATSRPQFTDADEERMAREHARTFEDSVPMWDDPLLDAYLTEITRRFVGVVRDAGEDRGFDYRVRVVEDPSVNAFTFGGGLIYVHGGLIARMENEAQFATVLGHEIAHVTMRHVPDGIEGRFGIQVLGQAGAAAARATGALQGEALASAYEYSMLAAVNGHSRGRESEADEVGLRYMVEAGYDPAEAPHAFEQLLIEYGDQSPLENFFWGSHPTNVSRFERLDELSRERYAGAAGSEPGIVNTEEFKRRTRRLVIAMGIHDFDSKWFARSRAMFEKARDIVEDDPVPHYYLGRIALETTRGSEAEVDERIRHLQRAIEADASFAPAYRELGLAYYQRQDRESRERAIAAFERYLEVADDPDDAERVRRMIEELGRY